MKVWGHNDKCQVQGMISDDGSIFTIQGHPEFWPEVHFSSFVSRISLLYSSGKKHLSCICMNINQLINIIAVIAIFIF